MMWSFVLHMYTDTVHEESQSRLLQTCQGGSEAMSWLEVLRQVIPCPPPSNHAVPFSRHNNKYPAVEMPSTRYIQRMPPSTPNSRSRQMNAARSWPIRYQTKKKQ